MKYLAHFQRSATVRQRTTFAVDASSGHEALDLAMTHLKFHGKAVDTTFPTLRVEGGYVGSFGGACLDLNVAHSNALKTPAGISVYEEPAGDESPAVALAGGDDAFSRSVSVVEYVAETHRNPGVPLETLLDALVNLAARDIRPGMLANDRITALLALATFARDVVIAKRVIA